MAGGGGSTSVGSYGGGGGAGGFLTGFGDTMTSQLVPGQTYPVTVGAGGAISGGCTSVGGNGVNSNFNGIMAIGGGGGGTYGCATGAQNKILGGQRGGSGGGGGNIPLSVLIISALYLCL